MTAFNDAKAQLTEDRLAEARRLSGVGFLPPGTLTELVQDEPFSVEDIVMMLLSGGVLQTEDIKLKAARISELEDLCNLQRQSIDGIADQATRLSFLVGSVFPNESPVSSLDMLKKIAASAR
jgi:hypothetical protein